MQDRIRGLEMELGVMDSEARNHSAMEKVIHRGSYMSVHVLLNLLNELRKRDKMRGLPSILYLSQRV